MRSLFALGSVAVFVFAGLAPSVSADSQQDPALAAAQLRAERPAAFILHDGANISRIGGQPLAYGADPVASAEQFRLRHAAVYGLAPQDLAPVSPLPDGRHTQELMYDPQTGASKFTLVYYSQVRDGVPVFRSDLRLLVRNEPNYPLVLAASSLHNLGDYSVDPIVANSAFDPAMQAKTGMTRFTAPEKVIWAGVDDLVVKEPVPAVAFIGETDPNEANYEKWLFVCDVATGEILYQENQIIATDVTGQVHGMATTLPKSAECNPEVDTVMPYARVAIGTTTAYADAAGNFTIPNAGTSPVSVTSYMGGRYFSVVEKSTTPLETLTQSVTPPGPANFMHNAANTSPNIRAQVNAYVEANRVRDWVLTYNPGYPTIATQTGFTLNVNYALTCNAYYDGVSLNFYLAGGGCANTAYSNVVHHEYGHHIVQCAGSGQGAYGEGMGDCVAALIADDPVLGYGFQNNCNAGIRTADNTCQYSASSCSSCGSEIHACGTLLSGIVWSIRTNLLATHPTDYLSIISDITLNSVLLHTGTGINSQLAIDFLTVDDNDGNIYNGTPHYTEICNGFSAHGLSCPALQTGLSVSPTSGFDSSGPVGGPFTPASTNYTVQNLNATGSISYLVAATQPWLTLANASGTLAGGASATVTVTINASANSLAAGTYADTLTFTNLTDHAGDTTRAVTLTVGGRSLQYEWNMDTNPGWTTQGQWAWGQPLGGGGQYGGPDPISGHTGLNVYGYNLAGDYANSIPEYHLTSTAINCTGLTGTTLRFWRWLGVEQPLYDHAYVRVSNNGTTWTTIWQNTAQVADTAWVQQDFDISAIADNQATVYLRWTMGTTDTSWQFCGWNIDDVQIWAFGSQTQQYTLTTSTTGQGSIALNPPGPSYPSGTSVTLTANAATNWTFDHWEGAVTGNANPATLIMDANKTVTAVFVQTAYALTVSTSGQGTVALSPAGPNYPPNTTVTLTANPAAGWHFSNWTGALTGSTNPATLLMDGDKAVTAVFVQDTYTLTVNITGQGTVALNPPGGSYLSGTSVTLTATPATGNRFDHWEGDLTGTTNPATLVMNANKTVTAFFAAAPSGPTLLLSFTAATAVPGVGTVQNDDVVAYDVGLNTWSLYFHGSDVGLSAFAITSLARLPSGELLMSVSPGGSIAGLTGGPSGTTITPSDIIKFTPTQLGPVTAGTWSFYFDGSDVGLTSTTSEAIDALAVLPDGRLLISTNGDPTVPGLSGVRDEDILVFTPTSLGSVTSGTWAYYFDGSDVSLTNTGEDVDGLAVTSTGKLLLSTLGSFSVPGVSGTSGDILQFTPTSLGSNTAGSYLMYLDISTKGISSTANVSGIEIIE